MEAAAAETVAMETASMEAAAVEAAASVKPTAPTMRTSVSGARLAQRNSEQQSSCGSPQNLSHFELNSFFA